MSEAEERALSRALHMLAPDPVVPTGLAELVQRRYSRRRALTVGGAVLVAGAGGTVAAGVFRSAAREPTGDRSRPTGQSLRDAVRRGRFTTTVTFDDGALTIAPPPAGVPSVDQSQAVRVFRSTGMPSQLVADVLVAYATVTVRADLRPPVGVRLDGVPAWVVVYRNSRYHCPMMTAPATVPQGREVFLLNAESAFEAAVYQEAGSVCGLPRTGPTVAVAEQYSSVPWVQVRREANQLTMRYQPDGGCVPTDVSVESSSTPGKQQLTVLAARKMWTVPCPGQPSGTITTTLPASDTPLTHAPTGPVTAFYTGMTPDAFDFYDGTR